MSDGSESRGPRAARWYDPERIVAPARWALRVYGGTTLLLTLAGAAAVASVLPVASLMAPGAPPVLPRIALEPVRGGDLGLALSPFAATATQIRTETLVTLFRLLLGVAAGVLAVAWITSLALAASRAAARGPEVRLRRAVGASRRDLAAAALLEGTLIGAAAVASGVAAGLAAARLILSGWSGPLGAGGWGPGAVVAVAAGAALLVGALMPLAFARGASPIRDSGPATLSLVLPSIQLGLALTVLAAGSLLGRGAARLTAGRATAGHGGQVFEIAGGAAQPASRAASYAALLDRLRADSLGASLTSPGTIVGLGPVSSVGTDCGPCRWGGGSLYLPWHLFAATHYLVSADTFRALAIPVVAGRGITSADRWDAPRVAVVNRTLAERHYFQGDALGKAISIGAGADAVYTVVGIVSDRAPVAFGAGLQPAEAVYLSVLQHPAPDVDLLVRRGGGTAEVLAAVRDTFGAHGARVKPLSEASLFAVEAAPVRWFSGSFGAEGWAMLALATLGAFALMWLWVDSLRSEFGVRRGVGARRRDILGYVLARAALVAAGGLAFGCWAGMMVWDALGALVPGLPAWDLPAVARFGLVLAAASLAGAILPALRAVRVSPAALLAA